MLKKLTFEKKNVINELLTNHNRHWDFSTIFFRKYSGIYRFV